MYVKHEGLGKAWYENLLDVAAETGASVVEGYGGKGAGDAVRGFHRGWTGAAFGSQPVPKAPPRPPAAPQGGSPYPPSSPAYYPQPPGYLPPPPPPPPNGPALIPRGRFSGSASLSGNTIVLLGGLGIGALLFVLAMKKNHVPH